MGSGPDPLTPALIAALGVAWRVFDRPAPANLGVCTACCMAPALAAEILATPARALTPHHLREWLAAAYDNRPERAPLLWLLPRMFELLAEGQEISHLGPEVVLARLPATGFPESWPQDEVDAVQSFCLALFDQKLAAREGIDGWLCMIARSGLDIRPFLDRLWALPDADLAALLDACWIKPGPVGRIPFTAFWSDVPARAEVWAWYTAPELASRLFCAGAETDLRLLELAELVQVHEGLPPPQG